MLKKIAFLLLFIAPMSVFAQKFAHFRSVDIIQVMPEFAKAQTDIQTMSKQYEDEIKRAEEEFQKKFADFQQEQKTLPQNILERRQKDLQEMQQKGIQFQHEAQQQGYELVSRPLFHFQPPIFRLSSAFMHCSVGSQPSGFSIIISELSL